MPSWSKTIQDIYKLIYAEESRRLDTVEIPLESDLAETPKMKIDGRMPLVEIYYRLKRRPDIEGIIDSCRSIYSNQGILVEYSARTTVDSFCKYQTTIPRFLNYEWESGGEIARFEFWIVKTENMREAKVNYRIGSTIKNREVENIAHFFQIFRLELPAYSTKRLKRQLNFLEKLCRKIDPQNPPILIWKLVSIDYEGIKIPIGVEIFTNCQKVREYLEKVLKMRLNADYLDSHNIIDIKQELDELKRRLYEFIRIIEKDPKEEKLKVEGVAKLEDLPNKEKYEYTSISIYRGLINSILIYELFAEWKVILRIGEEQGLMRIQEPLLESHHIKPPSEETIRSYL